MVLWEPSNEKIENSLMCKFRLQNCLEAKSYQELHQWSVEHNTDFWSSLFDFFDIVYEGSAIQNNKNPEFLSYDWFPGVSLNFAQNLLSKGKDDDIALLAFHESGQKRELTYKELKKQTAQLQAYIEPYIEQGDVLAAYMPNIPETVVAMLATTGLGGVFTSTSCDFGIEGVVDRFGQSEPKVLITTPYYVYNEKLFDLRKNIEAIKKRVPSIEKIIYVDFLDNAMIVQDASNWSEVLEIQTQELTFKKVSFDSPLYIMYSSGTTGKPKCIVHGVGGTLLQHVKELGLHTNLTREKSLFYFTTCGWMMWNWLVSGLFFGSKIVLFEGSPSCPDLNAFMKILSREKINIWGTSPKFLKAIEDHIGQIKEDLSSLETILSTGAPLLPEQFDYVYSKVKKDVQLSSISGGTDIISCFMLGNPTLPVRRGEIQCIGLGMDVSCFNQQGQEVIGQEGELVCRKSFPSQPIGFLNDPDNKKFKNAYFERFPGVWHHGDFVTLTKEKGLIVFGRSDATLNPGGVRIGTSEIYRQTEKCSFVEDSLCVGKQINGDVKIFLFVKLKENEKLTSERIKEIKSLIKKETTPRHIPYKVIAVSDIPYTRSGKKMELAITRIINGKELDNIEAVSNPESLEDYKNYAG